MRALALICALASVGVLALVALPGLWWPGLAVALVALVYAAVMATWADVSTQLSRPNLPPVGGRS